MPDSCIERSSAPNRYQREMKIFFWEEGMSEAGSWLYAMSALQPFWITLEADW